MRPPPLVTPGTEYGEQPSESAKMICADEARTEIEEKLGEKIVKPLVPTWVDHLYSCDYVFPDGTMVLSVKELPDIATTGTYFDQPATSRGTKTTLDFGEGGFQSNDDGVVVRKDNKVLDINVGGLPARVGEFARVDVGPNVAAVVMGCWVGA